MAANDYFQITLPSAVSIAQGAITSTCTEVFEEITVSCEGNAQMLKLTLD